MRSETHSGLRLETCPSAPSGPTASRVIWVPTSFAGRLCFFFASAPEARPSAKTTARARQKTPTVSFDLIFECAAIIGPLPSTQWNKLGTGRSVIHLTDDDFPSRARDWATRACAAP